MRYDESLTSRATSTRVGALLVGALVVAAAAGAAFWALRREPAAPARVEGSPALEPAPTSSTAPGTPALRFTPLPPDALSNHDPPEPEALAHPLLEAPARDVMTDADRALATDPEDPAARRRRALAQVALGEVDVGARALVALAEERPDDADAQAALGAAEARRGRSEEAEAALARALAIDPDHAWARRERGALRRSEGRTRDAYEDLVRAARLAPDDAVALRELAAVFFAVGRAADAAPILRALTRAAPDDAGGWLALSASLEAAAAADDEPREVDSATDEATQAAGRALSLAPDAPGVRVAYCRLLATYLRAGAVAACDDAIRALPGDPALFRLRARALASQRLFVRALADADRAVELAPSDGRGYADRAAVREEAGDAPGALLDRTAACRLEDAVSCAWLEARGLEPR